MFSRSLWLLIQSPTQPPFWGWRKFKHNEKTDEKWQMHTIYRFQVRDQTLNTQQIFKFLTLIFSNLSTVAGTLWLWTNEPPMESSHNTSAFGHSPFNSLLSTALMISRRATNHPLWCWSNSLYTAYETNNPSHCLEPLLKTVWDFSHCIPLLLSQTISQSDKG